MLEISITNIFRLSQTADNQLPKRGLKIRVRIGIPLCRLQLFPQFQRYMEPESSQSLDDALPKEALSSLKVVRR